MSQHDDQDPAVRLGLAETADTAVMPDAAAGATSDGAPPAVPAEPVPPAAPAPPAPPAAPAPATTGASVAERPTVRWGALVWGLLFGLTAATTLWIIVDPGRRAAIDDWFLTLNPLAATLYALVAVGAIVVLFGLVGLIRRGERVRR